MPAGGILATGKCAERSTAIVLTSANNERPLLEFRGANARPRLFRNFPAASYTAYSRPLRYRGRTNQLFSFRASERRCIRYMRLGCTNAPRALFWASIHPSIVCLSTHTRHVCLRSQSPHSHLFAPYPQPPASSLAPSIYLQNPEYIPAHSIHSQDPQYIFN